MADTNFDLAPPSKTVDGLKAVPIDIQKITATLTFDGATSSGDGDATLEFTTGGVSGNPIFDLRQTITSAWLDGVALPAAKLAHHDFGGGADAKLRIVESVLPANSTHKLRVKYTLGAPQASQAGSYLPAMTWSGGPRLAFNFGFTDLGAGRYLEAWIPANLIFDQFELVLTLRVLNTAIAHTVITNGTVASLGTNHWSAISTLLELRAADTLASQTGTKLLPVSNTNVNIEAWKLASSQVDLTAQLNNLKTYLGNNETAIGPYVHGNRFVAFLHVGGMEYEGGTTTGTGALRHETFHSWWARGLKPASQADAWWDEAWTVYNDHGANGSLPFDFSAPAVTLCPRNPWVRVTAGGAYDQGERFFQGVAALIGIATLNSLMSKFYKERRHRPATTTEIEEFLVCQTGNVQLVDAFHRFVYGFANPAPVPDLWLHDDPAHAGADAWAGAFWDSPDLWIRNADDGGTTHQNPEFGQDNWFYARVHNRSATATASHFLVTFNVKPFAGVEFLYPADFLPCIAAVSGFDLKPNSSAIVKARWPRALVPPTGTHPCWLAAVLTRFDQPVAGRHVWEHNNLAQKNLTVVNLKPNDWLILPFVLSNLKPRARRVTLELVRPPAHIGIAATLVHKSGTAFGSIGDANIKRLHALTDSSAADAEPPILECGGRVETQAGDAARDNASEGARDNARDDHGVLTSRTTGGLVAEHFAGGVETPFTSGRTTQLPISLRPTEQLMVGLRITVPPTAKSGEVIRLDLVQRSDNGKSIVGGLAVEIHIS
jgi:hypothetical protein